MLVIKHPIVCRVIGRVQTWAHSTAVVPEVDGSIILVKDAGSGIGGRETSWLHNQWKKTSKEHTNRFTLEV